MSMDYFAYYKSKEEKNTFIFQGKEYPLKSMVKLTKEGRKELKTNKMYAQIYWHAIFPGGYPSWAYITDWSHPAKGKWVPVNEYTKQSPDKMIEAVVEEAPLLDDNYPRQNSQEVSYAHPDILWQAVQLACWWFAAFIFKDWFLRLAVQIGASIYYGQKIEKLHNSHFVQSFNTVEALYGINFKLIQKYYLDTSVIAKD